jgi:hypothetical protein
MSATSRRFRIATPWVLLAAAAGLGYGYVVSVRVSRPVGPPPGVAVSAPWGAVALTDPREEDSSFELLLEESIRDEAPGQFDQDADGVREYDLLVLSGGGSKGAYGAGFLNGWTASGTRPNFKIVTGVSTGALQATFAFLGSDYDDELREFFTQRPTESIYTQRFALETLFTESACKTTPLWELLQGCMTDEVLARVAEKHALGHRLYVGTYNIDRAEFVIWDLGEIASSDRADKREHYCRVLLASAAIPVLFPPVYFAVDADGETYHEMHLDGGAEAQVCFRHSMLEFDDALDGMHLAAKDVEVRLFLIRNGAAEEQVERIIAPRAVSIAAASLGQLFRLSINDGIYRIYVLAHALGIQFHLAAIPVEFEPDLDATDFDLPTMKRLFDLGYEQAAAGYDWAQAPPGADLAELVGAQ